MGTKINDEFNSIFTEAQIKVNFIINKVKLSRNISEKERTIIYLMLDQGFSAKELADKLWPKQGEMRIKQIFLLALKKLRINLETFR
jgi:DNA-directed RNA polymerase specialized sigma subunit